MIVKIRWLWGERDREKERQLREAVRRAGKWGNVVLNENDKIKG
jgi:hypothetical protein